MSVRLIRQRMLRSKIRLSKFRGRKIDHDVGYDLNNPSCSDAKRSKTNGLRYRDTWGMHRKGNFVGGMREDAS